MKILKKSNMQIIFRSISLIFYKWPNSSRDLKLEDNKQKEKKESLQQVSEDQIKIGLFSIHIVYQLFRSLSLSDCVTTLLLCNLFQSGDWNKRIKALSKPMIWTYFELRLCQDQLSKLLTFSWLMIISKNSINLFVR